MVKDEIFRLWFIVGIFFCFCPFDTYGLARKKTVAEKFDEMWKVVQKKHFSDAVCLKLSIQDERGQTLLHRAIKTNSSDLVDALLAHKSDILIPDSQGKTPLDLAVLAGDDGLVHKLLASACVKGLKPLACEDDISFGIVDLKFDGEQVKICELGEASRSKFQGYDTLFGQGIIWQTFWKFLSVLGMPTWFVTGAISGDSYAETALKCYEDLGGRFSGNLGVLGRDTVFEKNFNRSRSNNFFPDKKALVITKNNAYRDCAVRFFKKKFQPTLFLSEALGPFGNSKLLTNTLFKDARLSQYRPRCKVCKKLYTRKLVKSINDELQCERFVIKPINSSKGQGIIFVEKKDLKKILQAILIDPKKLPDLSDPTYSYWLHDRNQQFMIEEYAPSKEIAVKGVRYDATMRVIFVLMCDQGKVYLHFLGAYWKLPSKGIREGGSLTEQHKSHINPRRESSAKVDLEDYEKVKILLRSALSKAYLKMMQDREAYYKSWERPSSAIDIRQNL